MYILILVNILQNIICGMYNEVDNFYSILIELSIINPLACDASLECILHLVLIEGTGVE